MEPEMRSSVSALFLLLGLGIFPAAATAGDPDRPGMTAAARELARQMSYFQEIVGTNDRLQQINGLGKQTADFQAALIAFRQKVADNAPTEEILVAVDPVEKQLASILLAARDTAFADRGVKMVCNRLRAAGNALNYAVFSSDATPARVLDQIARQTAGQQDFIQSLGGNVSWMFTDPAVTKGWQDDLGAVQQAVAALQQLGQDKATEAALREQVARTDQLWDQVMKRYDDSKQYKPALRSFVAQLDQGFWRLSRLTGVKDRRAPLTDGIDG
jgi:hypothetical protein